MYGLINAAVVLPVMMVSHTHTRTAITLQSHDTNPNTNPNPTPLHSVLRNHNIPRRSLRSLPPHPNKAHSNKLHGPSALFFHIQQSAVFDRAGSGCGAYFFERYGEQVRIREERWRMKRIFYLFVEAQTNTSSSLRSRPPRLPPPQPRNNGQATRLRRRTPLSHRNRRALPLHRLLRTRSNVHRQVQARLCSSVFAHSCCWRLPRVYRFFLWAVGTSFDGGR